MKLECRIRRAGGTETTMPNPDESVTAYHFKPIDPTRADSPHVAEVSDQAHYDRFIAVAPECYVPFDGKAPKVDLPKPQAPVITEPVATDAPLTAQAERDAQPSWAALQSGIKAGTFSQEQLREWMAAEEASDTPRPGYIAAIVKALT